MPSIGLLDKWKMHRFYSNNAAIAKYLPPTGQFTKQTLSHFMNRYKKVYIKAARVHTGRGIVKAWKSKKGYRFIKIRGKATDASSTQELYRKVKNALPVRSIIIQKAIDLAPVNGRTFDIRVMMMRDAQRQWQYGGMVAKVAGSGSIISNVRRGGGYVLNVEESLRKSLKCDHKRAANIKKELIKLSRNIMKYSEKHPFFSYQCGIDLAVDKKGKVWVIEVNLHNPSHGLFNKLTDKTFYRRIGGLYRAYRKHNKRVI